MKTLFNGQAPSFDREAIHDTIQRAFASAGLDTTTGPMHDVSTTIRQALGRSRGAVPTARDVTEPPVDARARGRFDTHTYSHAAGSRRYKLYVPAAGTEAPRTLLVMLHGCTQSADDFAAGTQMNRLADAHGFLVVYPEQSAKANVSKCWNWFEPRDQRRDAGEPALLAGIVREVAQRHDADAGRIFVAGLSAGAAMAVVLGQTDPELFAGVGEHSGLAYGRAHDVPSALAAMKGGRSGLARSTVTAPTRASASSPVPVIVFHGDRDHTVQASNGADIVQQAHTAYGEASGQPLVESSEAGVAAGRRFSRRVYRDARGRAQVEHWTLHGAGHAWSGGHASGSYTDARGPDASAEMLRFFLEQSPVAAD